MFKSEYAVYLGKDDEGNLVDFIYLDDLFIILSIVNIHEKEKIHSILKGVEETIIAKKPQKLFEFEEVLLKDLITHLPSGSSVACGLHVSGTLYLKTYGDGEIYLNRKDKLVRIIAGDSSASGHLNQDDFIILTTQSFFSLMTHEELKNHLISGKPKDILDKLTPQLKEKEDSGNIALFIHFEEKLELEETGVDVTSDSHPSHNAGIKNIFNTFLGRVKNRFMLSQPVTTNKKITLVVLAVLLIVFIWSVVFGFQRRERARIEKLTTVSDEIITQKLNEASDISILNLSRAQVLLVEAKQELNNLESKVKQKDNDKIIAIKDKIVQFEKEIIKAEEKKPEVFYDLKIINEGAEASEMFKFKSGLALLNSIKGEIYLVDIEKKSVQKTIDPSIKGSKFVALNSIGDIIFVNPTQGVFKIEDKKVKKVIDKDDEWSNLADFWIYNNNLYLVDEGKDEIYKYLVAENGYSSKTSYFKSGQSVKIDLPASISIDSALYLASGNKIIKYLAGVKDEFSLDLPNDSHSFAAVFTDVETNKVYILDKENAKVYILSKNGQYEKQIESSIIKSADDFVVSESQKAIYILIKDKIYKLAI